MGYIPNFASRWFLTEVVEALDDALRSCVACRQMRLLFCLRLRSRGSRRWKGLDELLVMMLVVLVVTGSL